MGGWAAAVDCVRTIRDDYLADEVDDHSIRGFLRDVGKDAPDLTSRRGEVNGAMRARCDDWVLTMIVDDAEPQR